MSGVIQHDTNLLRFSSREVLSIILLAAVLAIVVSFRFFLESTAIGVTYLILTFLGMIIAVWMHEFGHKIIGMWQGTYTTIQMFSGGLAFSVLVAVYTFGFLPIATPNLSRHDVRPDLRLHRRRKHDDPGISAFIAAGGLAGTTIAIILFKTLHVITGGEVFALIVLGAVIHGFYSLIPFELITLVRLKQSANIRSITPGDGLHIFWWSAKGYVFALIFMLVFGMLALTAGVFSYIIGLGIAIVGTWAFSKWAS